MYCVIIFMLNSREVKLHLQDVLSLWIIDIFQVFLAVWCTTAQLINQLNFQAVKFSLIYYLKRCQV